MSQDFMSQQEREQQLRDAQQRYAQVANQRLQGIAQGGSPSPLASPWLAAQQAYAGWNLGSAEDMPGIQKTGGIVRGQKTPEQLREERWQQAIQAAQALQGTGRTPKPLVP